MIEIFRPMLMESTDGLPLATKISDLFTNFPYDRVPADPLLQLVLRPEGVAVLLGFYLISKSIFVPLAKIIEPKASWFIFSIALHNFLLAIFSLAVVVNTWPIVFDHYKR